MRRQDIVVGLDIGTTKICTVVVREEEDGAVEVLGAGFSRSVGLTRAVVADIDDTVASMKDSLEKAERMAGRQIEEAYVGITGGHIGSVNTSAEVAVDPGPEVSYGDIERVLEAATHGLAIPSERKVIHRLVRQFILDGQPGVRQPIGMSASTLGADVHVVTGTQTVVDNFDKCMAELEVAVVEHVLEPVATAEAVLDPAERDLGVILIDIGGGTTDIAVFHQGSVCHTSALSVAGHHVTRDVAIGLRAGADEAETLKQKSGDALADAVAEEEEVTIRTVGEQGDERVPRRLLAEIIQPRLEEIFLLVREDVKAAGVYDYLAAGVVVTGGGSQLPHTAELASEVFDGVPVRVGKPRGARRVAGIVDSPMHATGVGLALYGVRQQREQRKREARLSRPAGRLQATWQGVKSWFRGD